MPINHTLYPSGEDYKWQGDPDKAVVGSGFSVPRGIEAVLSYNNLVMNDLSVYDKYRVMSIDGLADPDVRDNREDNAGDDGDLSYESLYGGRTIVINVRIEAYSLDKLRDMEEALRTAFSVMEERELYFLTGEPEKDHYIKCKKSAALTKTEDVESMGYRHFREWQITLRASDPRFYRNQRKSINSIISVADPELNASSAFESSGTIDDYSARTDNGAVALALSTDWSSEGTQSLRMWNSYEGNWLTNDYSTDKLKCEIATGIIGGESYTISGNVKYELLGTHGFAPATLTPYIFYLSSSGSILGYNQGTSQNFYDTQEFNFSVTGTSHQNTAKVIMEFWVKDYTDHKVYFDEMSIRYSNASASFDGVTVVNEGNYSMYPVITLTGEIEDISIHNSSAPKPYDQITFKTAVNIAEGDSYIIDCAKKTIVDSSGNNVISDLDISSGWIKLYPGRNEISFGEQIIPTGTQSQLKIEWKDAWI